MSFYPEDDDYEDFKIAKSDWVYLTKQVARQATDLQELLEENNILKTAFGSYQMDTHHSNRQPAIETLVGKFVQYGIRDEGILRCGRFLFYDDYGFYVECPEGLDACEEFVPWVLLTEPISVDWELSEEIAEV